MNSDTASPTLLWFRRDLRLSDHHALIASIADGGPVIPVFIRDNLLDELGAAPKWRLGLSVDSLSQSLSAIGSKMIYRTGDAAEVLVALAKETGAKTVRWSRAYDPAAIRRDIRVKAALTAHGIKAKSHLGHLLFQPWEVETKTGDFYKVYSPFWRSVSKHDLRAPLSAPTHIPTPQLWPASETLESWKLGKAMQQGADIVGQHICVGEQAAQNRLDRFLEDRVGAYKQERDIPSIEATSRLSENLTYGEISPIQIWHQGQNALLSGAAGAEHFLKELVWREFAYHLIFHTPHIETQNWRDGWDAFTWRGDNPDAEQWRRGMTGEPMVDAGLRELYVTGTMHNRVRMLVASYLCKHLMTHWRIGQAWFEDCLIDWDPAANAMGWQWVAGSGPDAAPYFRVFNPALQAEKFDSAGAYRRMYLAGFEGTQETRALSYFKAVPASWKLRASQPYPEPLINLAAGRDRALAAYKTYTGAGKTAAVAKVKGHET